MAQSSRTFRIFVSSTFSDLKEERNALQEKVFPRLRDLAVSHSCRFQAIDLRWGVSEEAALDQQTMKICLNEIERCQKTSPKPNFLVLLGDRYGWRPIPAEIPADEFEQIISKVANDEKPLLEQWYRRDDNSVPPVYCLQARSEEYVDYSSWEVVETRLRQTFLKAIEKLSLSPDQTLKYLASATEQEIVAGALRVLDAKDHVFCFFREISGLPKDETSRDFHDSDAESSGMQKELKARLKKQLAGNVHEYTAQWQKTNPSLDHLEQLCEDVYNELSKVILAEAGKLEKVDSLDAEIAAHETFGKDRARVFIGRADILNSIEKYISGSDSHPLAIWGASGSGKSALMAKAVEQAQKNEQDVLYRFIGATPESSNGRALLESLCRQISCCCGADESTIPSEYKDLVQEFPKRLALAKPDMPLIIFLDALDQLSDTDNARSLIWLPANLPLNVRLIVSTLPGECLQALVGKLPPQNRLEVQPMSVEDGKNILTEWLSGVNRQLQKKQKEHLLGKFHQCGLPLYLKLAFEEARLWKSYEVLPELGNDIPGILRDLFKRLSLESNHGEKLVSHSLGYIAAGKNGLSEDELLDVLSMDQEMLADFQRRSPKSPKSDRLPVVIWSRLYFDLEPYLTERSADGASLLAFYHRQMSEAVEKLCNQVNLFPKLHEGLANYFGNEVRSFWIDRQKQEPDRRKTSEIAFQQAKARNRTELKLILTNFDFLQARLVAAGPQALIADYDLAIQPSVIQQWVWQEDELMGLNLIRDGLRLSAFAIIEDHHQLIPQLWGRLVGYGLPDIQRLLEQSKGLQDQPWLRPVFPCFTPPGGAEVRTLIGHQEQVTSVAISPNGKQIVSGSSDKTIKIWEFETGVERLTLTGHLSSVTSVAITPDGRWIISGSNDRTLKIWNLATGSERLTLNGHTAAVNAVAITPDGSQIVSASGDGTLKIWDLETGANRLTLVGHKKEVVRVAITPDGKRIVSASNDVTHKIWDLKTGKEIRTHIGYRPIGITPDGEWAVSGSVDPTHFVVWRLDGRGDDTILDGFHGTAADGIAITPDGRLALTAGGDHAIKAWDIEKKCEKFTIWHSESVNSIAITPDGRFAVSASNDKTLKIWNLQMGDKQVKLPGHNYTFGEINALDITRDGLLAVSASGDRMLKVWDVLTGLERCTFAGHNALGCPETVAITPNGHMAVSAGSANLMVWDLETGQLHFSLVSHSESIQKVVVTPDGRLAVSASRDNNKLEVWNLQTGEIQFTLSGHTAFGSLSQEGVYSLVITPNGELALSGAMDNTVKVWDLKTGTEKFTFIHTDMVYAIAITPDGRFAVSAEGYGDLRVWDLETGLERHHLSGHKNYVRVVEVTPDGRLAVSVSRDKTIKVWDLEKGKEKFTLLGHNAGVYSLAISPDGRLALTGSEDRTLKVWDLRDGSCIATFSGLSSFESDIRITVDPFKIIIGDKGGHIFFLALENWSPKMPLVTAWKNEKKTAFGCPYCNIWSQIPESVLGSEIHCTHCGNQSHLNQFTVASNGQIDLQMMSQNRPIFKRHQASHNTVIITPDGRSTKSISSGKPVKMIELRNEIERLRLESHQATVTGVEITSKTVERKPLNKKLKFWLNAILLIVTLIAAYIIFDQVLFPTPDVFRTPLPRADHSVLLSDEPYMRDIYIFQGETSKSQKTFCFYIGIPNPQGSPSDSQKIFSIPDAIYNNLTRNPEWLVPQGIVVKNSTISMAPRTITWKADNSTQYSAPGTQLTIEYKFSTTSSYTPGYGEIGVSLPNLSALKAIGTFYVQEDIGYGCESAPKVRADFDKIKLNNVVAFTSIAEKEAAVTKRNIMDIIGSVIVVIFVVIVVVVILLFAGWVNSK